MDKSEKFIVKWEGIRKKGLRRYMIAHIIMAFTILMTTFGILSKLKTNSFFNKSLSELGWYFFVALIISILASYFNGWRNSEEKYKKLVKEKEY